MDSFLEKLGRPSSAAPRQDQKLFALEDSISAEHDGAFTYAPGMDVGFQLVTEGQVLGHFADGHEVRIPLDGMLLFPKAANQVRKDSSLFFIARRLEG